MPPKRNDDFEKSLGRMMKFGIGLWLIWATIWFAAIGAIVYVAYHFTQKYW